jgi:uncharacterized protein
MRAALPQPEAMMADAPSSVHPLTHNFLGKEMYLVITRPVRSPEIEKRLSDHLAHQVELERKGIMFAAGPLYPKGSQTPEAGMFVLRANSFEEAEAIAATDPLHAAGLRTYTIQKWRLNEGSIKIKVNYSDQTVQIT